MNISHSYQYLSFVLSILVAFFSIRLPLFVPKLDNIITQHYCCVMIPALIKLPGAPWKVLPINVHPASLAEVRDCFAINPHRRDLFDGLVQAAEALAKGNVRYIYLDGSFVTGKPMPSDYDGCWSPIGVTPKLLDPVFFDFNNGRAKQKARYKGEFFPSTANAAAGQIFVDFFQTEKFTGLKKGIILIDLKTESFDLLKEVRI